MLVGRDLELGIVHKAVEAAHHGAGGTVLLLGEAGVGKSRLVAQVCGFAREAGLTVACGRAVQAERPAALRPLAEAVLAGMRAEGLPEHPDLDPFRATLGRLVPQWGAGDSADGPSMVLLGEAVLRLARVLGRRCGFLLVLEDLHWADPETLAVVEYLADNLRAEPTLLLATLRPGTASPMVRLAHTLQVRNSATVLDLARLDRSQVIAMVRACLGDEPPPPEVDAFVAARADGIPLFVEELLTGLITTGALSREDGGWVARSRLTPRVPLTFGETVTQRLTALPSDARRVVEAAALLGRRFDWSPLASVTGLAADEVLAALRVAIDVQLLVDEPDGFRFRHALTRDAVLAELLPPARARLASRAADALEAADSELPDSRCELAAELREHAGQADRAADLLHMSARRAMARGALTTAEATLCKARELVGDERRITLDESLVEVLTLAGRTDEAFVAGARVLAGLHEDLTRAARTHLRLARAAVTAGRWRQADAHLKAAARVGADPAVDALRAQVAIGEGRVADAVALAQRAVGIAEQAGEYEAACEALEVLGRAARLRDLAEAEAAFQRAHRIADAQGLVVWRIRALHELGTIDLHDGRGSDRLAAAREEALAAGALATAAVVDLPLSGVHWARHELDVLLAVTTRCVQVARRLRLPILPMALLYLAGAHGEFDRREEMEAGIAAAHAAAPGDPEVEAAEWGHIRWAYWLARAEDARALDALDRAMSIYRVHPELPFPFRGVWVLLHTVLGDGAAARTEVRAGPQLTSRANWVLLRFADAVALGRSGHAAQALEGFAEAVAAGPSPGARVHQHVLRLVSSAALRDGWGEPVTWLRQALDWFEAHNQQRAASSCRRLLRQAGVAVPRRGRGDATVPGELRSRGITSREMDVLLLVAEGLSNPEIAATLVLSPRTVEKHVASLLTRTGSRSRAQLAALAARSAP
jgi:DNA-binding CsgD family transcriptional regulator/tetratricopeptide (TPR) repeat protein